MIILETDRLIIRTWELTDVEAGMTIWGDPEVMRYVTDSKPMSREAIRESIKRGIDHQMKYGYQHWAVILKETNALIGACGFNSYQDDRSVKEGLKMIEMVFHFAKKYWGNGYATEAASATFEHAKKHLNIDFIVAGVNNDNVATIKILERLGFYYKGLVYFEDTKNFEPMFEYLVL